MFKPAGGCKLRRRVERWGAVLGVAGQGSGFGVLKEGQSWGATAGGLSFQVGDLGCKD